MCFGGMRHEIGEGGPPSPGAAICDNRQYHCHSRQYHFVTASYSIWMLALLYAIETDLQGGPREGRNLVAAPT